MASDNIEVQGLDSLLAKLDSLGGSVTTAMKNGVDKTLKLMTRDAKLLCRVDTGVLRNSIQDDIVVETDDTIEGTCGTNVDYAIHNELGTSKMSAQPFITPAFEQHAPNAPKYIRSELNKEIKKFST